MEQKMGLELEVGFYIEVYRDHTIGFGMDYNVVHKDDEGMTEAIIQVFAAIGA